VAELLAVAPMTAERLAQATGVNASALGRVMRALVRFWVFSEDSTDRFALAPLGELLQHDRPGSLDPAALFFGRGRREKHDELARSKRATRWHLCRGADTT
jgi:hypothetical protein